MIIIKAPGEVAALRRACRVAADILGQVAARVVPGATTEELDQYAAQRMHELGAASAFLGYHGYPGHICVSINEEVVHGLPSKRRIRYGDVVSLDVGVSFEGWIGDNAVTVAVGMVDPGVSALLAATEAALAAGVAQARPGRAVGDISHAVEECVQRRGFSVVREYVGHGIGRTMHEEPQIPNYGAAGRGPRLRPGMTLAIEPMVNLGGGGVRTLEDRWTVVTADGLPSAHFEHTVLVTEGEPEILTCRSGKPFASKAPSRP